MNGYKINVWTTQKWLFGEVVDLGYGVGIVRAAAKSAVVGDIRYVVEMVG